MPRCAAQFCSFFHASASSVQQLRGAASDSGWQDGWLCCPAPAQLSFSLHQEADGALIQQLPKVGKEENKAAKRIKEVMTEKSLPSAHPSSRTAALPPVGKLSSTDPCKQPRGSHRALM